MASVVGLAERLVSRGMKHLDSRNPQGAEHPFGGCETGSTSKSAHHQFGHPLHELPGETPKTALDATFVSTPGTP